MATVPRSRSARKATVRDLHRVEGRAELINGRIVRMSSTGYRHGQIAQRTLLSVHMYAQATRKGKVYTGSVAFLAHLTHRGSFSPDVAYYTGPPPDDPMDFLPCVPDFAVEIRSKRESGPAGERRMKAKRLDYFTAGTKVVWDVDPRNRTVSVYRAPAPQEATVYKVGQTAEAEPALPGWRLPVKDIFG